MVVTPGKNRRCNMWKRLCRFYLFTSWLQLAFPYLLLRAVPLMGAEVNESEGSKESAAPKPRKVFSRLCCCFAGQTSVTGPTKSPQYLSTSQQDNSVPLEDSAKGKAIDFVCIDSNSGLPAGIKTSDYTRRLTKTPSANENDIISVIIDLLHKDDNDCKALSFRLIDHYRTLDHLVGCFNSLDADSFDKYFAHVLSQEAPADADHDEEMDALSYSILRKLCASNYCDCEHFKIALPQLGPRMAPEQVVECFRVFFAHKGSWSNTAKSSTRSHVLSLMCIHLPSHYYFSQPLPEDASDREILARWVPLFLGSEGCTDQERQTLIKAVSYSTITNPKNAFPIIEGYIQATGFINQPKDDKLARETVALLLNSCSRNLRTPFPTDYYDCHLLLETIVKFTPNQSPASSADSISVVSAMSSTPRKIMFMSLIKEPKLALIAMSYWGFDLISNAASLLSEDWLLLSSVVDFYERNFNTCTFISQPPLTIYRFHPPIQSDDPETSKVFTTREMTYLAQLLLTEHRFVPFSHKPRNLEEKDHLEVAGSIEMWTTVMQIANDILAELNLDHLYQVDFEIPANQTTDMVNNL
jgi:hypothetical protein